MAPEMVKGLRWLAVKIKNSRRYMKLHKLKARSHTVIAIAMLQVVAIANMGIKAIFAIVITYGNAIEMLWIHI